MSPELKALIEEARDRWPTGPDGTPWEPIRGYHLDRQCDEYERITGRVAPTRAQAGLAAA